MPSSFASYKLFPDKWYRVLSLKKFAKAKAQLNTYATSKELDTGLSEVNINFTFISKFGGMRPIKSLMLNFGVMRAL